MKRELRISLHVTLFLGLVALFCPLREAFALRGITERDSVIDEQIRFHGHVAVPGEEHTISIVDRKWPQEVTFVMHKDRSLRVRLYPIRLPASVVMLASRASSPRVLRATWAYDDLRSTVTFWTDDYWSPLGGCDTSGCPRIRFQALRGTVGLVVVDKRKAKRHYFPRD